jgi:hypothetical protein
MVYFRLYTISNLLSATAQSNLKPIASRKEQTMHASIRRYEGLDPASVEQIIQRAGEGFVPIVSEVAGFVGYYIIDAGDGVLATISVFESEAAAEESNQAAASWVKENLAELVSSPPQITAGEARVIKLRGD